MKPRVDIDEVRTEVRLEFFKKIQRRIDSQMDIEQQKRIAKFDEIFNMIVEKKINRDEESLFAQRMKEANAKRMNPFYITLQAQKEDREKYMD